ncbi:MAG: glycosyltransferase family 4 protein [Acidobacteriota bacterium]
MRILQLVDGDRWTGPAAVVFDQTAALIEAGVEAQFGFIGESLLSQRLLPLGWARPLMWKPRGPLSYARQVRTLRGTLLREKFDLVHAHRSHDHSLAALAVRGTPARLVRTLHHVRAARPDPVMRAVSARTDAFAYANREIGRRFGRPGPVLPPVVDTERFRPRGDQGDLRRRFGLPAERFLVGTVGKISAGRGHEQAIEAAAPLPGVALVHVGHGERRPYLEKRAAALGVADRNFWVGYQEENLPDLYRSFDAFLLPASGSDQGQRAILEAMASGLPVAALEVPGVSDLLTDGVEGLIARDAAGLSGALRRLLEDVPRRAEMGRRAGARALEFTAAGFARKAIPFYEAVLGGRLEGAPLAPALSRGERG